MALSGPYRAPRAPPTGPPIWGPQRVALESQAGSLAGSSVGSAFRSADSQAQGWIFWISARFWPILGLIWLDLASGFHALGFCLDSIRFRLDFGWISVWISA